MKLFNLLLLSVLLVSLQAKSQKSSNDVFNSDKPITFLGLDFSKTQFIGPVSGWGDETTKSPKEIRDKFFPMWNNTIEKEPQNFKFAEATGRSSVTLETKAIQKTNENAKTDNMFLDRESDAQELSEKDIQSMVKKYDYKKSNNIGLSFICEQINKNTKTAIYWITFIDMNSGKVLLTKKVYAEGSGFGFKNFWLGSVKSAIKKMKKDFNSWK